MGESHVGFTGTGSLQINGGLFQQTSNLILGYQTTGNGTVTVSSGTLAINYSSPLQVGFSGTGSLLIDSGGLVTTFSHIYLGYNPDGATTGNGSITVTGQGSILNLNGGGISVGSPYIPNSSNNTVTIADGALVRGGIGFSTTTGTNNFLRLDGGYLALVGYQTPYANSLLSDGYIQIWDGSLSQWVTATAADVQINHYNTSTEAEAATGYSGLGDFTVITTPQAVPEPGTCALLALGAGALLLFRKRRNG